MRRTYFADSDAPVSEVWSLLARPDRWHEWSPHVRGAWGLGSPEVTAGSRGFARLLGVVPVPARVVSVDPGRAWVWHVGPMVLEHAVEPRAQGSRVRMVVSGPLAPLYGPVVGLLTRHLAAVAAKKGTEPFLASARREDRD